MRTKNIFLCIFIFMSILFLGCEKNFRNPYDDNAPKDFWKPKVELTDSFYVISPTKCRIFWTQGEKQIDGFKVDKKIGTSWVNAYAVVSRDSLSWTDNTYVFSSINPVQYRIYAYAANNNSEKVDITINPTLPTLTTNTISEITPITVTNGGNITTDGKTKILSRGVCWSTSQNPIITDNHTVDGAGTGSFASNITGLSVNTTYYFRAYATNIIGIAYGNEIYFNTILIGQSFQGGKIAYILQPTDLGYMSGQTHGLIAAPNDQSTGIKWYNVAYTTTGATATAIGTGNANTNTIVANQGAGSYAAKLCIDLVLNGYNDWYLPSKDELNQMYLNKIAIGGFTTNGYWSSSKYGDLSVWSQYFSSGFQDYGGEGNYVRAVRAF